MTSASCSAAAAAWRACSRARCWLPGPAWPAPPRALRAGGQLRVALGGRAEDQQEQAQHTQRRHDHPAGHRALRGQPSSHQQQCDQQRERPAAGAQGRGPGHQRPRGAGLAPAAVTRPGSGRAPARLLGPQWPAQERPGDRDFLGVHVVREVVLDALIVTARRHRRAVHVAAPWHGRRVVDPAPRRARPHTATTSESEPARASSPARSAVPVTVSSATVDEDLCWSGAAGGAPGPRPRWQRWPGRGSLCSRRAPAARHAHAAAPGRPGRGTVAKQQTVACSRDAR